MSEIITLKGIIDEDFVNYKVPSMVLMFPKCSGKCGELCQNKELVNAPDIKISLEDICTRYKNNPITHAIVLQGLEPLDSFEEVKELIYHFRHVEHCDDDIVIYTGYDENEISDRIRDIKGWYSNIIVKFGRYIPGYEPHYDKLLGVKLASDNQYAKRFTTVRLSEDGKLVKEIREKLKANGGYCPCRVIKNEDTKCMCKEFREQESGECHCGLYVKV